MVLPLLFWLFSFVQQLLIPANLTVLVEHANCSIAKKRLSPNYTLITHLNYSLKLGYLLWGLSGADLFFATGLTFGRTQTTIAINVKRFC